MVNLTVDGVEVSVERGTSILDAAKKAGIRIPTLCHDKRLIPYGSCRLCVVEVTQRGRTRTMPACFNPARDGMVVTTHTPALIESRRRQLEFLLRSHPLLCPSCDAAGDCELQNLVFEYQVEDLPFKREGRYYHVDNDSHFIRHNMNLCIRCGMCVRICDEVQGQNEITFIQRGMYSEVSTDFGRPLDCEFCGQCAGICPTGAIRSRWLVGTGRDFELTRKNTTCSFCSLGCTLTLGCKDETVVYVTSPADSPNEGNLCVKGRYGWPYIYSEQRLDKPGLRKNGSLQSSEWDEAIGFAAAKLNQIKEQYGPDSIAGLGSERLTNEEAYLFNRLIRGVLGSPNLDHAGGYTYRPMLEVFQKTLGYPAGTNAIRELRHSDVILLVGADLTETHPVAKNEIILATGRNRSQAIVINPIRDKLTDRHGMYLGNNPGTEYIVLNGMLKYILDSELYDKTFVEKNTSGFEELSASLANYSLDNVTRLTGVAGELIENAATQYAKTDKAAIVLTSSMNRQAHTLETAQAAVNLALLTGKIGKEACGIHMFGEKANFQGAIDMGLAPDYLPGHVSIDDKEASTRFDQAWGIKIPDQRGLSAQEIISKAASGDIKALYIVGENPLDTYPDRAQVELALKNLELLIVQDLFASSTSDYAHVVFPVVSFAEKYGTFTSTERLIQLITPVLKTRSGKPDFEVFTLLAEKLGNPFPYRGPEQVMAEIASLVPVYAGITYQKLRNGGIAWPCLDTDDPGKPILYQGGFSTGKAQLVPPAAPQATTGAEPFALIPVIIKFHNGSFSTWSPSMMEVCPNGFVELNRKDMATLGIDDGRTIKITNAEGSSFTAIAKRSRRAEPGRILVPTHFGNLKLNGFFHWGEPAVGVKIEALA